MLRLSEEVDNILELSTPLIIFFGLPPKKQIAVLPILENKEKYDFPDGDLITSNVIQVLICCYKACLNSILISLIVIIDKSDNENSQNLVNIVEQLLETTLKISAQQFETINNTMSLKTSEWNRLRQLSLSFQDKLDIYLDINTNIMRNCIEYWLHS
jgi:hypothetical protein